eukprot:13956701-Alexandrium_andersonii.AAC.1
MGGSGRPLAPPPHPTKGGARTGGVQARAQGPRRIHRAQARRKASAAPAGHQARRLYLQLRGA